jgi:YD repeat-containing protein
LHTASSHRTPVLPPNHAPAPTPPAPSTALQPEGFFWQNFRFATKQHGKTIATRFIRNKPIYSASTKDTPAVLDGATVWLEYDAEEAVVEVTTPGSKTFDLQELR